jgi:RNA polymerase sigma-70 factor (ECF subfamily)
MRAAIAGDDGCYRLLLEALSTQLRATTRMRLARGGCGDRDVEDVVQETLLAIHLKRHTWRTTDPIGPWVSAIARNKLVDVLRRRGRHAELPMDDDLASTLAMETEEAGTSVDVDRLLSGLPSRQRDIVQLVSIEGHSARVAAERLGMSEGALRVALHRCLRTLAASLKDEH